MITDAKEIVYNCLLCVISCSLSKFRDCSPGRLTSHPKTRSLTLTTYSLRMVKKGTSMLLSSKDDLSNYEWISDCSKATAVHAAEQLNRWQRTFTAPKYWVSDQWARFVNDILRFMVINFGIQHCPTVAYSPLVNRTVECLVTDILAALGTMIGELK